MTKKVTTGATKGHNAGIHDARAYRKACQWLENHTFTNAQLWHVVFKGNNKKENTNRDDYETALDRLCEKLRDAGMPVEWRSAYEVDDTKGFHRHVFLLVEAAQRKPVGIIRHRKGGWLTNMLEGFNLECWVARPQNDIHKTRKGHPKRYAYVAKTPGPMLDDCKDWLSYIYKVRSKAGVVGTIYSSSRKKATKKEQAQPTKQAEQACEVGQAVTQKTTITNDKEDGMTTNTIQLSPAGFKYLGQLYEQAVDKGLNLVEIQAYLSSKGIHKPMIQIKHDLDHTFGFAGYTTKHPAPPKLTLAQIDSMTTNTGVSRKAGKLGLSAVMLGG